jgi:hypothetical protein
MVKLPEDRENLETDLATEAGVEEEAQEHEEVVLGLRLEAHDQVSIYLGSFMRLKHLAQFSLMLLTMLCRSRVKNAREKDFSICVAVGQSKL